VLAMPIKSILAIFILAFYMPIFMPFAQRQFPSFENYMGQLYEILKFGEKVGHPAATVRPPVGDAPK
jgi:type III secretion protein T